ncbi:MAG: hypothetical protein KAG98_05765 [Lentisphaeria bacterium]|nr:hypothetical protein [Lentisphaeria bacterium]
MFDLTKAMNKFRLVALVFTVATGNMNLSAESPRARNSYVVVVRQSTFEKAEWRAVVNKLRVKYEASVVTYTQNVLDTQVNLSKLKPNYTCFVTEPEDATLDFVVQVQRLTRAYDEDLYTDTLWGILTGYTAADALRIASLTKPLIIRRALGGSSALDLNNYEEGIRFNEGQKGGRLVKRNGGPIVNEKDFPADSTQGLVDGFNKFKPDVFYTSGHGFPGGWQIGFNYKDGFFRSKAGQVFGVDTKGKKIPIDSPNSKVYLPYGNCLIGQIKNRDAYALAMMHSAGVNQMFGYVVVTFFGYMGWGIDTYFTGMRPHYSLSESFYANQQALLHVLDKEFPKLTRLEFSEFTQKNVIGLARKMYPNNARAVGLFWDRDAIAFYGDPAWKAVYPPEEVKPWDYAFEMKGDLITLTVSTLKADKWSNRPIVVFMPKRFKNIRIRSGQQFKPVLMDNFILLPFSGNYKAGENFVISFNADVAKRYDTSSKENLIVSPTSIK